MDRLGIEEERDMTNTHCGKVYVCSKYTQVCACYCEPCATLRDRRREATLRLGNVASSRA